MCQYTQSYASAARAVLLSTENLRHAYSWRHHRLGMLQGEINDELRIHIWHPALVVPWANPLRAVHDHRFDLVSYIAVGVLGDQPYDVREDDGWVDVDEQQHRGWKLTSMYAIAHAKVQTETQSDVKKLGRVWARPHKARELTRGDVYSIQRRAFHTTLVSGLAITVVHRSNFDNDPARILGSGDESGIIKPDGTPFVTIKGVYETVMSEAEEAVGYLRAQYPRS